MTSNRVGGHWSPSARLCAHLLLVVNTRNSCRDWTPSMHLTCTNQTVRKCLSKLMLRQCVFVCETVGHCRVSARLRCVFNLHSLLAAINWLICVSLSSSRSKSCVNHVLNPQSNWFYVVSVNSSASPHFLHGDKKQTSGETLVFTINKNK